MAASSAEDAGGTPFHCFDVVWDDGGRNSECVATLEHCTADMEEMRGYASADARFQGCFPQRVTHCYDASGSPLCFVTREDCEASRRTIPGGACAAVDGPGGPQVSSSGGQHGHGQQRGNTGSGGAGSGGPYHCFEVSWDDGRHNSECVFTAEHCARDLAEMRGYSSEDARFQGCFTMPSVYCYDTGGETPLCFTNRADCETSREWLSGGECQQRF